MLPTTYAAITREIPLLQSAGWEVQLTCEVGNPYISHARAKMLGRSLAWGASQVIFIDDDVAPEAGVLLKLLELEGEVVGCTYRCKNPAAEKYMGCPVTDRDLTGIYVRADGCIFMDKMPAGCLRISASVSAKLKAAYPELVYTGESGEEVDLFNHGAYRGDWWGEDFAFCRRWRAIGGEIWCAPFLKVDHYDQQTPYGGQYGAYLASLDKSTTPATLLN